MNPKSLLCVALLFTLAGCQDTRPQVLAFGAKWCQGCHGKAAQIDALERELQGRVRFVRIDVDDRPDLVKQFKITDLPAYIVIAKGKVRFVTDDPQQLRYVILGPQWPKG